MILSQFIEITDLAFAGDAPPDALRLLEHALNHCEQELHKSGHLQLLAEAGVTIDVPPASITISGSLDEAAMQLGNSLAQHIRKAIGSPQEAESAANELQQILATAEANIPEAEKRAESFWQRLKRGAKNAAGTMGEFLGAPVLTYVRALKALPTPGQAIIGMERAQAEVVSSAERDLSAVAQGLRTQPGVRIGGAEMSPEMDLLASRLGSVTPKYGVTLRVGTGLPLADWKPFPTISIGKSKGFPHEMIHGFQMSVGGASGLGTVAAERLTAQGHRPGVSEILREIRNLSADDVASARSRFVAPAETQAYALYEAGAGLAGSGGGAVSPEEYKQALLTNIHAFAQTFREATHPALTLTAGTAAYGAIGQVVPGGTQMAAVGAHTLGAIVAAAFLGLTPALVLPVAALPFAIAASRAAIKAKRAQPKSP